MCHISQDSLWMQWIQQDKVHAQWLFGPRLILYTRTEEGSKSDWPAHFKDPFINNGQLLLFLVGHRQMRLRLKIRSIESLYYDHLVTSTRSLQTWAIYLLDGEGKLLFKDSNHLLLQTIRLSTPTHILRVQRSHIFKHCFQSFFSLHLAPHHFPFNPLLTCPQNCLPSSQDFSGTSCTVFEFDQFHFMICFTIKKNSGSAKDLKWAVCKVIWF